MTNLLSYCGLVDARISASEKDLPVTTIDGRQQQFQAYLATRNCAQPTK
jgi:hypothetical protein